MPLPFPTVRKSLKDVFGHYFIEDPLEQQLPVGGLVRIRDRETDSVQTLNLASHSGRAKVRAAIDRHRNQLANVFKQAATDAIWLRTDEDFFQPVRRYLESRRAAG